MKITKKNWRDILLIALASVVTIAFGRALLYPLMGYAVDGIRVFFSPKPLKRDAVKLVWGLQMKIPKGSVLQQEKKFCLIQLSTAGKNVMIESLKGWDLPQGKISVISNMNATVLRMRGDGANWTGIAIVDKEVMVHFFNFSQEEAVNWFSENVSERDRSGKSAEFNRPSTQATP